MRNSVSDRCNFYTEGNEAFSERAQQLEINLLAVALNE